MARETHGEEDGEEDANDEFSPSDDEEVARLVGDGDEEEEDEDEDDSDFDQGGENGECVIGACVVDGYCELSRDVLVSVV